MNSLGLYGQPSRSERSNCHDSSDTTFISLEMVVVIHTTSVNEKTLDEAPMAYKSLEDIIDVIRDSVDVIDIMKPIYNFKAAD